MSSGKTLQPIILSEAIDGLLRQCSAYDHLESAVALFDTGANLLYGNPAFTRFNLGVRDSIENLDQTENLLGCPRFCSWLTESLSEKHSGSTRQQFYYAPQISVELNVCIRLILTGDGAVQGGLMTLGEESIEFEKHHLARAQASRQSLLNRIEVLEQDKLDNDHLIRVLLKDAPFAMILLNKDRKIVQSNRSAEVLFKTNAAQMVGQACDQILPCYGTYGCCPALEQDHPESDEIEALIDDDKATPLLRNTVVLDADSNPLIVEAFIDLTERVETENKLKRLNEYNRLLVESTGEGIFSVDKDLYCTFANNSAARMLGYTPDEILGQDIYALFHSRQEDGKTRLRETLPIVRAIETNSSQEGNEAFWAKQGHVIPVQYLCNPLHDGDNVTGAVVVYRNVAEARAISNKMDYLATHDLLTGLPNRHNFEKQLVDAVASFVRHRTEYVLCYIDLDQFKVVNDTCGHAAGDELLRQLGNIMHEPMRKSDVLARLGGDEFGMLLAGCSLDKAITITEKLVGQLSEYRFSWEGKHFSVGASIGIVQLNEDISDASAALRLADSACYIAKDRGRNRLHVYQANDQDMTQRQSEIEWVSHIKKALDEDQFSLWAQAIVLTSHPKEKYRHFEVLVRMKEQDGSMISPGAFIPAAERYGLMASIDRWVIRQTLEQVSKVTECLTSCEFISINLSGQSISDEKFLEFLLGLFSEYPSLMPHICFEITETAAVANLSRASQFMRTLKKTGCCFALDDFGSGMSSFSYLKSLPIDFLKIDGNFVRDMSHDKVDYAMVEAIHRVGSVMGIKTIAEYVEDDAIIEHLKRIGVNYAQGYGVGKPEPLDEHLTSLSGQNTRTGSL